MAETDLGEGKTATAPGDALPETWRSPDTLLSAERTVLSWLRTGLALIGFGFLLERFDFYLRSANAGYAAADPAQVSHWVGVAMVAAGAAICVPPALALRRFVRAYGREAIPSWYRAGFAPGVGVALGVFGALLAACLVALPLLAG